MPPLRNASMTIGLGPVAEFSADRVRQAAASAAKRARELGAKSLASTAHGAWQGWWIAALATAALWLSFSDRWDQPADGVRNG